jgi:hypothetical protein
MEPTTPNLFPTLNDSLQMLEAAVERHLASMETYLQQRQRKAAAYAFDRACYAARRAQQLRYNAGLDPRFYATFFYVNHGRTLVEWLFECQRGKRGAKRERRWNKGQGFWGSWRKANVTSLQWPEAIKRAQEVQL